MPISIVNTPRKQRFQLNEDAFVTCIIRGEPDSIYWKKGSSTFRSFQATGLSQQQKQKHIEMHFDLTEQFIFYRPNCKDEFSSI